MNFVEKGRVVFPRELIKRHQKAVVTDIIDNKFIVILHQNNTHEIVRVDDIVLGDEVLSIEKLEESNFYKVSEEKKTSDFERFKEKLREKVASKLLEESSI
ncbi:hypothetical protein NUSPORA_02967 [Nucleospora cyclopteri]